MKWYFSRALTAVGLLAGLLRVGVAAILDGTGAELLPAIGMAVALLVGGMLTGVFVDLFVELRRRSRRKEPERTGLPRKR